MKTDIKDYEEVLPYLPCDKRTPCQHPLCTGEYKSITVRVPKGVPYDDYDALRAFDQDGQDVTDTAAGQWCIKNCIERTEEDFATIEKEKDGKQ